MITLKKVKIALLMSLLLCSGACSGGSGGGGGSDGGESAETGVRILHGAIDHAPFSVRSSLVQTGNIQSSNFAQAQPYGRLPEGAQSLTVSEASNPAQALFSFNVEVQKRQRRSLLIYGGPSYKDGFRARLLDDLPPEPARGNAALRVINAADNAFEVQARLDGSPLDYLGLGEESAYHELAAGLHTVTIKRTEDDKRLAQLSPLLEEGRAYTLLLAGDGDYFVTTVLLED